MKKTSRPKTLPSSKRESKRYVVFDIISESHISTEEISNAIWFSALNYLGEFGTGKAGIWVGKDLFEGSKGMVKCNVKSVNEVKSILMLINRIGDSSIILNILGVTGTIDSAKKKYFKQA